MNEYTVISGQENMTVPNATDYTINAASGTRSVAIGFDCTVTHNRAVLIGSGLKSDHDYQLKIGNTEVSVSRTMTPAEFQMLYATLSETLFKSPTPPDSSP